MALKVAVKRERVCYRNLAGFVVISVDGTLGDATKAWTAKKYPSNGMIKASS